MPDPSSWATPFHPNLSDLQKRRLLGSLEIFRQGETGEGRILNEIEKVSYFPVDQEYRKSLRLFVAEEGKHARILGRIIRVLENGGASRPSQVRTSVDESEQTNGRDTIDQKEGFSYRLFYAARGLMGVRLKLMVLLCAEIIGCECYGILGRALKHSESGKQLLDIQKDEEMHLRFHCQFFHLLGRKPIYRKLLVLLYLPIALCACFTVLLEHRSTFQVFQCSFREAARLFMKRIRMGMNWIYHGISIDDLNNVEVLR